MNKPRGRPLPFQVYPPEYRDKIFQCKESFDFSIVTPFHVCVRDRPDVLPTHTSLLETTMEKGLEQLEMHLTQDSSQPRTCNELLIKEKCGTVWNALLKSWNNGYLSFTWIGINRLLCILLDILPMIPVLKPTCWVAMMALCRLGRLFKNYQLPKATRSIPTILHQFFKHVGLLPSLNRESTVPSLNVCKQLGFLPILIDWLIEIYHFDPLLTSIGLKTLSCLLASNLEFHIQIDQIIAIDQSLFQHSSRSTIYYVYCYDILVSILKYSNLCSESISLKNRLLYSMILFAILTRDIVRIDNALDYSIEHDHPDWKILKYCVSSPSFMYTSDPCFPKFVVDPFIFSLKYDRSHLFDCEKSQYMYDNIITSISAQKPRIK
jgi:hypothetical protein